MTTYNAILAIGFAGSAPTFPPGTVVASLAITVTGTAAGNTTPITGQVAPNSTSATVDITVPDTYTASVQAQDANGNALGPPATDTFVVTAPATVSLSLPSTVTVTVTTAP